MSSLAPKTYMMSLTAQQIEQRLMSIDNMLSKDAIRQSLSSPDADTVPSTAAVADALEPISQAINGLGDLAPKDSVGLDSTETSGVLPISKGGSGGSNLTEAQQNLGILSESEIQQLINSSIPSIQQVWLDSTQVNGILPLAKGGTGSSSPSQALKNLGIHDSNGKVPVSQLPAIAITDTFPVSNQAAMLALSAEKGDVAIRTDINKSFILMEEPASTLSNWKELLNDAEVKLTPQIHESLRRNYARDGYNLVSGSFEKGGTLTEVNDVLLLEATGKAYSWGGVLPKVVPADSTPATTGGINSGAWVSRYDSFKNEYNLNDIGNFSVGLSFSSFNDIALFGDMYYMPYGNVNFPLVVTSTTPDPLIFKCCGELKGYPINDIRNFGALPYPEYSHEAINLAIKFINPYVWRGTIAATYTNGPVGDGTVLIPAGWWRCGDKIYHNPGVRLKGVSPARRIYGRKTPTNNLLGSVILGDSTTFRSTYLIDTANYKNDGTRLYLSSDFITATNIDVDGLYAASEGSLLEDLFIVHATGFFGGFRQHWAMRGGYRNISVSGFKCNASCNQVWNQITDGLWSEDSDIPQMIAETTTQIFSGPHTLLGKGPEAPTNYADFPVFLSGVTEDGVTLAVGQKLVSRSLFVAYCEHPVFTALVTEYSTNPILVRDTRCLTLTNYHEEVNGTTGWAGYKSVIAGWASRVEVKGVTSLSNIPFFAMGNSSKGSLTDSVQQNGASQSNVGFTSTPMQLTLDTDVLPSEIIRGGEVVFLRNKPTIYVKNDGNPLFYGHHQESPTTINEAIKHLSLNGIRNVNIVLIGEVIRTAGGFGVFDEFSISGSFSLTHSNTAPEFFLSAARINKTGVSEYCNSRGFTLSVNTCDITHKNTLTSGAFQAYKLAGANAIRFTSEAANVGTVIFDNSVAKVVISGASNAGGITASNIVNTPVNALLNFIY